ncbi:SUN domain-containing ossification factor [Panulirus ornatus]|uniref:SUN domain-containing ossification factor n=1 Tax=Panulirus ornatus TaxID=150431 RepID=UPI003A86B808
MLVVLQLSSKRTLKNHIKMLEILWKKKVKEGKISATEKLVDVQVDESTVFVKSGIEHETEQTVQQESDVSKKVKPSLDIDVEVLSDKGEIPSDIVIPEDDSEKAKKKSDSDKKKKKEAEGIVDKPPETIEGLAEQEVAEKSPDTLETYSQFTQRVNAEKKNDVIANSHGGNGHGKGPKVKSKNYASPDCGSKLLTANPEATHASKVIQSNKDEYLLNKCRDKTWFIIELCESIRPQMFDIANFELFSNLPKDIHVFGSHRYPTRDWTSLSRVMGQEANRGVQSFPITTEDFFKYIKVEVLSHYGSEFFCPISLFRIYGLSEFEVIDTIEDSPEDQDEAEEAFSDSFEEDARKKSKDEGKPSVIPAVLKNMFSGVLDVIKRGYRPTSSSIEPDDRCYSLHHRYAVDNSRCPMAETLNYILSCYRTEYEDLMLQPFVSSTVKNSSFCRQLASAMCTEQVVNDSVVYDTACNNSYVCVMLSPKHVLAMCFMHDNRIMDTEFACDSIGTHLPENFSATSSDVIPDSNEIPAYVKNGEINTSSITRTDAADADIGGMLDIQGKKLIQEKEGGQTLLEQKVENESVMPSASETLSSETPKVPKKSKTSSVVHHDKHIKESDFDNITEPEENVEVEGSGFGGIDLEEEEFPHGEELTTPTPAPVTPPHTEPKVTSSSPTNKESVVVRLSNKIKALEYNMSISSQYLEELSRRYKRQMEEMQRQFNLTIAALNATSRQAYERDQHHQRDIEKLEEQLVSVSNILDKLVEERETLAHTVVEQHLLLMVVEVLVLCVVFAICNRRTNHYMDNALIQDRPTQTPGEDHADSSMHQDSGSLLLDRSRSRVRRRSVDSITRERASRQRQRRPSEEALKISGTYQDLLIIEPTIPIWMDSVSDRKKKKKSSHGTLKRSKSNASIVEKSSSSRKSHRIEKLNTSSAGVLFYGDSTVTKDPTPPLSNSLSSPDSPDSPGFPYEPFVNEQEMEFGNSGVGYDTCVTRAFVEGSPDGYFSNNTDIINSKRHSIACFHNCDNLHKKGTRLLKSLSVSSAPEKLKNSGEKIKKLKKVKKIKNNVNESFQPFPVALEDHGYYYQMTGGTSYNCQDGHYGEYYYSGHTNVHFSEDINGSGNHDLCYPVDTPCTDSFVNGDSSCATDYNIGNDYIHTNHDKSLSEKKKVSHKTKVKVKLRSDNWEWYSAQHFGSSSSETVSTCSDSSGKNRRVKTEEKPGIVEKAEDKKVKKKKKSKTKSPVLLEEEAILEGDAGT